MACINGKVVNKTTVYPRHHGQSVLENSNFDPQERFQQYLYGVKMSCFDWAGVAVKMTTVTFAMLCFCVIMTKTVTQHVSQLSHCTVCIIVIGIYPVVELLLDICWISRCEHCVVLKMLATE